MAKKAKMANISTMRGVNIFKDGIPGAPENDAPQRSEHAEAENIGENSKPSYSTQSASAPSHSGQPGAASQQASAPAPKSQKIEKKTLRSYHLTESLISKLEDAHMVYSLKKIDKSKQDIVAEALEKHFADLEQQGFFQVLELLRN